MDLVFQIALQYGKGKITEAGIAYAMDKLGMSQSNKNPQNAISFGGINLNPKNMLMRAGLNKVMSGGKGFGSSLGSGILPIVALAGLGMYRNPLRQGAPNFSPNLAGQIDYLSNRDMIGRNTSSGLMQYGPDSVLRGQNVVSAFGTNNYQTQLQNYIDKLQQRKDAGKNFSKTMLDKALAEKKEFFDKKADTRDKAKVKSAAPTYTPPNIHSGGGGDGGGHAGGASAAAAAASQAADDRAAGAGGYYRGGIASL